MMTGASLSILEEAWTAALLNGLGCGDPPMVIDGIVKQGDALLWNAEGPYHLAAGGGNDDHLVGKLEQSRPEEAFDKALPRPGLARIEAGGVSAKKNRDAPVYEPRNSRAKSWRAGNW